MEDTQQGFTQTNTHAHTPSEQTGHREIQPWSTEPEPKTLAKICFGFCRAITLLPCLFPSSLQSFLTFIFMNTITPHSLSLFSQLYPEL